MKREECPVASALPNQGGKGGSRAFLKINNYILSRQGIGGRGGLKPQILEKSNL